MVLAKHIDPEELIASSGDHPHVGLVNRGDDSRAYHANPMAGRYSIGEIPKYKLPEKGVTPQIAYQLLHDELELDGTPLLNLASFVHTYMPAEADKLMQENMSKNLVDQDEYQATMAIHARCISMISHLWKVPKGNSAIGTACTGSSEGIMLGGLALKKSWQAKMKAAGKDIHNPGPNMVFGSNAQVCIEKFARYFDVEPRTVNISKESNYCMSPKEAIKLVDENTIGVFVILGSTYTGHFEPVQEMSNLLDEYEAKTGISVPIHVDGASGAFFAPFAYPDFKWSFDIPRVFSINGSGHKYGMTYVGLGWVVWRDQKHLPKELIFELHYLGSTEYSFNLNFSRPAAPVIAQMFNFLNLGFEGYRNVMRDDLHNARLLSRALEKSEYYEVLSDIHRPLHPNGEGDDGNMLTSAVNAATTALASSGGKITQSDPEFYVKGLPVVSFKWTDEFMAKYPTLEQASVQHVLRAKGWIVPNYALAPSLEKVEMLRVVVRESMSMDLVDRFVADLMEVTESLIEEALKHKEVPAGTEPKKTAHGHGKQAAHRVHHDVRRARPDKHEVTSTGAYAKQC